MALLRPSGWYSGIPTGRASLRETPVDKKIRQVQSSAFAAYEFARFSPQPNLAAIVALLSLRAKGIGIPPLPHGRQTYAEDASS